MTTEAIVSFIIPIALSGLTSLVAFVFLLPTKVGERLLAHHFEAKIAELKHEQGKEMGRLQADLDHLKDRGIRSNEKEFQAITAVWESFVDAFLVTNQAVTQVLEYPDLNKLSDEDATEFLNAEKISDRDVEYILSAKDRNSAYGRHERARLIWLAGDAVLASINLLRKQSVFIPVELAGRFDAILQNLNMVRVEQHMKMRPSIGPYTNVDRSIALVGAGGERMFDELRDAVRARLLRTLELQRPPSEIPDLPSGQKEGARA